MVKYGDFHQLFSLACTGSGGVVRGKDTIGDKY